jgi:serine/threonine-protein kinase RsbW
VRARFPCRARGGLVPGLRTTGELESLEVPAQPAFVGVARSVVAAIASTLEGIDEDRLEDLRVAVSEAVTNAVEAHRRDSIDDKVLVVCTATTDQLEVRIEYSGNGFDPLTVPEPPDPTSAPTATSERGWGIQLIQALVDDVTFRQTDEGTAVDLVVRFERSADADGE